MSRCNTNNGTGLLQKTPPATYIGPSNPLSCLDENGDFVSWWFMYKTPNGDAAAYFDPHSRAKTLDPSGTLSDPNGPLLRTLNQLKVGRGLGMGTNQASRKNVSSYREGAAGVHDAWTLVQNLWMLSSITAASCAPGITVYCPRTSVGSREVVVEWTSPTLSKKYGTPLANQSCLARVNPDWTAAMESAAVLPCKAT